MTCTPVKVAPWATAIVCTRGRKQKVCAQCGRASTILCDWKIGNGKTCDVPCCRSCAHSVAYEKDLCGKHWDEWQGHAANPTAKRHA